MIFSDILLTANHHRETEDADDASERAFHLPIS